jgi:hypothetical protein
VDVLDDLSEDGRAIALQNLDVALGPKPLPCLLKKCLTELYGVYPV